MSVFTRLSHPISMSNEEVEKDIRTFVAARLDVKFLGWRAKYKANIREFLVSKAQGMFRLAFCHVEIISKKRTESEMFDSLKSLPQTIEETYELILLEIDEQDRPFARIIFLWVCGNDMLPGNEPISIATLLSVLNKSGLDSAISVSENRKALIVEICSCMLTISATTFSWEDPGEEPHTEDVDTAKCAHYTVVEYLFSEQIKASKAAYFSLSTRDIVAEFVATTITVAETVDLQGLRRDYWESFQCYCVRAAWLSTFTWESELTEHAALWMGLIHIWSNDSSYFTSVETLFWKESVGFFPKTNRSCLLTLEPDDEAQHVQEFAPGILACLFLNSSHILANKLVSHYGSQILEVPFHFNPDGRNCGSKIPLKAKQCGSAIEAALMAVRGFDGHEDVLDGFERFSYLFDNTQLVLICIGVHVVGGCDDCYCGDCRFIKMLLQYFEAGSDERYCLTVLQLSVYCLDICVVRTLLDLGVDPNGVGARDGKPTPIYLYQVDDRWWSSSPLHMIRHAGFAAEEIDGTVNIMKTREAQRCDIERMLIEFGGQDFVHPTSTSASISGSTGLGNSSLDEQLSISSG